MSKRPAARIRPLIIALALLAAGAAVGWMLRPAVAPEQSMSQGATAQDAFVISPANETYRFIKPLLAFELSEKKEFAEFKPLEKKLAELIASAKAAGRAADISVYLRDLNTKHWTGIDENALYAPASLIKVPLMMAFYKRAEERPELLDQEITIVDTNRQAEGQEIKPAESIKGGRSYSIAELMRYMIVYSDNDAAQVLEKLQETMRLASLEDTVAFAGLEPPKRGDESGAVSPKQFSLFFRMLYNATYLNRAMSEKAMELLSQVEYADGLLAGVPADVAVAHKFGESGKVKDGKVVERELHDCGIVYLPERPYLLCVMTRGRQLGDLSPIIGEISRAVYQTMKAL